MRPDEPVALDLEHVLRVLGEAELEVLGMLPYASNATLLVKLLHADADGLAVYKPRRGERPLWDFPDGTLYLRERAAWIVDAALGWGLVPPTVIREGPAGIGAVQLWIEEDPDADFDAILETHADDVRRIAVFDALVNNADRKASHSLLDVDGKLWAIDHGVCFHEEHKLRTVIWAFAGERVPPELIADVDALRARLAARDELLRELLHPSEIRALAERAARLVDDGRFPAPGAGRRHVPWPPW